MAVQRLPIIGNMQTRKADVDVDLYYKNCYPEGVDAQNPFVIKRPGYSSHIAAPGTGVGRGVYQWRGYLYSVVHDTLYKDGVSIGTLNTTTGPVYFTETGGGSPKLVLQDKTDGWIVNTSDTVTEITDVDFPANLADGIAFMDQFVFLLDENGNVWNSTVNDPSSWNATYFINAESKPDGGVYITEHLNYIIAFGDYSTDFFYNAGNASASTLSAVGEASMSIGLAAAKSVCKVEDLIYFIGQDRNGERRLYKIKGLSHEPISPKPIERILNSESDVSSIYAYSLRISGHSFYCLNLPNKNLTLVYDAIDGVWHTWTSYDGSSETEFVAYDTTENAGVVYFIAQSDGAIYKFDEDVYQDNGNTIKMKGVTDIFDGGSTQNKFCTRLEVVGDRAASSGLLYISYTDDDYQNYSPAIPVDMSGRPAITRLGRFQRRAFRYTWEENLPLRLEGFDLNLNVGVYGA